MGIDQVSKHDHSTDADGGDTISPTAVDAGEATIDGHRVYIQSTAPSNPSDNDIWFDLP